MADDKKPPPNTEKSPENTAENRRPSLEEFLVACQKSLARSVYAAEQASKADTGIAKGERHFYSIDFLDFNVSVAMDTDGKNHEGVRLDFQADPSRRSSLNFRLEAKPAEFVTGAHLQLANLDPLGQHLPDSHLRIWLVDSDGEAVPDYPVALDVLSAGAREPLTGQQFTLTTDVAGRINFWIRPLGNEIEVLGGDRINVELGGSADLFVSASCELQPPFVDAPLSLSTEVCRLRASRQD